ncbi:RNA-directed DNA polymerase, eukaryota, reverse transcriptase zinc-binding domain protein [Tanacetum coccineum]
MENVINGDDRDKEMNVIGMMDEFPTIDESMNNVMENVNDVDTESDELEPMINNCNDLEQQNTENCDKANEFTCNHGLASNMKTNGLKFSSSYAKVTSNKSELSKELLCIPTGTNDNGDEVVIFEEDLVKEGLGEIIADNSDISFFKFKSIEGMNFVIEQSPWMVNGRPFVVKKWDTVVCIEKADPCKIPIWIKLLNVPLKAWSTRGISALVSRLGRPIMMDNNDGNRMTDKNQMKGNDNEKPKNNDKSGENESKPDEETIKKWTYDMKQYFKYKWETLNRGYGDSDEENEVLEDETIDGLLAEEINGNDNQLLN